MRGCSCRGTAGFAHVSCLAEQAKILFTEAEENNLDIGARFQRWHTCSLCEQYYHGVVYCALGWACWKTYLGRPERDRARIAAITELGIGLFAAQRHADALSVQEADLATLRRIGATESSILDVQSNLANTYDKLGRSEEALQMQRHAYSGRLRINGVENLVTLTAANNYAFSLVGKLQRYQEARSLMRKTIPVARRVLGERHDLTFRMRWSYAEALYSDDGATLDDLREAVTTLEDVARIAQRVLGGTHPFTSIVKRHLRNARAALRAREEGREFVLIANPRAL